MGRFMHTTVLRFFTVTVLAIVFAACKDTPGLDTPATFAVPPLPFPEPAPVTLAASPIVGVGFLPNGTACAVSTNGMYLSTDGGTMWTATGAVSPGENIHTLAIDGAGTMYLGTDSSLERLDPNEIHSLSLDVLRSTDVGRTWQKVFAFNRPMQDAIFLACNRTGDLIAGYYASGFAVSTNKGNSWTRVSGYWCSGAAVSDSRTIFMASAIGHVRRSDDLGMTWSTCPGLPPEGQSDFLSMFATPNADTVFVVDASGPRLWYSANSGVAWTPVWTGVVTSLCQSPRGNFYFASGNLLYRSVNGGRNWSIAGKPGTEIASLAVSSRGIVLVGTVKGTVIRWQEE
jgi:hypothetical protein